MPQRNQLTTPPTSPVRQHQYVPSISSQTHPSIASTRRTTPGPRPNPVPGRNDFEAYLMSLGAPVLGFTPTTDEDLNQRFRLQGFREDQLAQARHEYDQGMNTWMAECGGKFNFIGRKPQDNDEFQIFHIPNTTLAIRLWDGGMEGCGQYMIDFYDTATQTPVNSPPGYELHPVQTTGMLPMAAGRHPSWENIFGYRNEGIVPGEEKFCVPEGSRWRLVRRGLPDFLFAVPQRAAFGEQFAMPVRFQPHA